MKTSPNPSLSATPVTRAFKTPTRGTAPDKQAPSVEQLEAWGAVIKQWRKEYGPPSVETSPDNHNLNGRWDFAEASARAGNLTYCKIYLLITCKVPIDTFQASYALIFPTFT